MAHNSHIVFDGYSYEPPSYEEAQASASDNQSVYKPTVSQSQDTNIIGFRPLYMPNGYNGLTEYNLAKRRRRMRIAAAAALCVFSFIIVLAILFWNISAFRVAHKFKSYADKSDEDLIPYQSFKDSSIYNNNNNNNNYYREPVNDYKPIQDSDDDILDKTEVKVNVENHNDPFTNNGGYYGGYDWEKQSKKILEQLQSDNFGIHNLNTNNDKFFSDTNESILKEIEKLNLNQFKDHSANTEKGKETFANRNSGNPFDLHSILQKEFDQLKVEDPDTAKGMEFFNSYLQKELGKSNLHFIVGSPRNPKSTPDKADINISTGKNLDEEVKMPDFLTSPRSGVDINKTHDLLKSLKVDNNDSH